jgi:hypothetical protein
MLFESETREEKRVFEPSLSCRSLRYVTSKRGEALLTLPEKKLRPS